MLNLFSGSSLKTTHQNCKDNVNQLLMGLTKKNLVTLELTEKKHLFVSVLIQNLVSVRLCETYINMKGLIETAFLWQRASYLEEPIKLEFLMETRLKSESDTIHKHNNFQWCREIWQSSYTRTHTFTHTPIYTSSLHWWGIFPFAPLLPLLCFTNQSDRQQLSSTHSPCHSPWSTSLTLFLSLSGEDQHHA